MVDLIALRLIIHFYSTQRYKVDKTFFKSLWNSQNDYANILCRLIKSSKYVHVFCVIITSSITLILDIKILHWHWFKKFEIENRTEKLFRSGALKQFNRLSAHLLTWRDTLKGNEEGKIYFKNVKTEFLYTIV